MYGPIPEVSPGARSVNEAIAHARAIERRRIIGRPPSLTLTERIARAAGDGVIGRRAS
jgi:hypothetical protein